MSQDLRYQAEHTLKFGKTRIPFHLELRQKRRLSITVNPDLSVHVIAPRDVEIADVLFRVQKRAAWISKKRAYFEKFHPLPHEQRYVSGETHLYLGRQYRLKLVARKKTGVKLIGKYFYIYGDDRKNKELVKVQLDDWYRARAEPIFADKLKQCVDRLPSLKLAPKKITIRRMSKRWGSCTKTGNIRLNLDLIKAPLHCIEYVIAHELCHLRVHDHSPAFYRLLSRCMPDWKKRKDRLTSFMV